MNEFQVLGKNAAAPFTRGFIASQAFVDYYCKTTADLKKLLPPSAAEGLAFIPTHPRAAEALAWMGFEVA